MPRPGEKKSTLSSPFKKFKDFKSAKDEKRSRLVAEQIAKNTNEMISKLNGIDIYKSGLSKKEKDEAEEAVDMYVGILKNSPHFVTDVRNIDDKLLAFVDYFEKAVNESRPTLLSYSISALAMGLNGIRKDVPSVYSSREIEYIDIMTKYLDDWISVLNYSNELDTKTNEINSIELVNSTEGKKYTQKRKDLTDYIRGDGYADAVKIRKSITPESRLGWDKSTSDLYNRMLDLGTYDHTEKLRNVSLNYLKTNKGILETQLKDLHLAIATIPDLTDPEMIERYRNTINHQISKLAESDQNINEGLEMIAEIDGQLDQLKTAPGNERVHSFVAEKMDKAIEDILKKQDEIGKATLEERSRELRARDGIKTSEEIEEMEKQYQEERLKRLEEERQALEETAAVEELENLENLEDTIDNNLYVE